MWVKTKEKKSTPTKQINKSTIQRRITSSVNNLADKEGYDQKSLIDTGKSVKEKNQKMVRRQKFSVYVDLFTKKVHF